MDKKSKTACFTGHRDLRVTRDVLENELTGIVEQAIQQGYCYFGAGGARGFDSVAASVVLRLKEKYPHIHLILVLPFPDQYRHESGWGAYEVDEYISIREKASKVVYISPNYYSGVYYKRNRHLVDNSSLVISYQYQNLGGTAYTINYAAQKGVKIINCNV